MLQHDAIVQMARFGFFAEEMETSMVVTFGSSNAHG
jgi:hypothetical protein